MKKKTIYIAIFSIIVLFIFSCKNNAIVEEQKILLDDFFFVVDSPKDVSFPLYEENIISPLKLKLKCKKSGYYSFQWILRNNNEAIIDIENISQVELKRGEEYELSYIINKCNYINTYLLLNIIIDETESLVLPKISISQTMNSGIPTLFIETNEGVDVTNKTEWIDSKLYFCFSGNNIFSGTSKIKGRGNTSWLTEKKPYSLKLESKHSLLGMETSKRWVLINNHVDKSLLRNILASNIGNTIFNSYWNPSFESVDLVLNNEYKGTYILGESIKIDKKRVNIQSLEDSYIGKGKDLNKDGIVDIKDGGFILEINNKKNEFHISTDCFPILTLKDPEKEDFSEWTIELENYITNIVKTAEESLYSNEWLDIDIGYKVYFDIDSIVDWYLVSEFLKSADANFNTSVFIFYDPSDCKIHFGPNWDFDDCCGNYIGYGEDVYSTEGFYIYKNVSFIKRLFEDSEFKKLLKNRWNERKGLLFELIQNDLQKLANTISNSAEKNFIRYPILGSYVFDTYAAPGYEDRLTYQNEVDYLIDWCKSRYEWFDKAINQL